MERQGRGLREGSSAEQDSVEKQDGARRVLYKRVPLLSSSLKLLAGEHILIVKVKTVVKDGKLPLTGKMRSSDVFLVLVLR